MNVQANQTPESEIQKLAEEGDATRYTVQSFLEFSDFVANNQ